jgi:uncharacterized membrane protein YqiK
LPAKVLAGIVVGVVALIAIVGAVLLWFFGVCFGRKKGTGEKGVEGEVVGEVQAPPGYGEGPGQEKGVESQVKEVPSELR